VLGPTYSDAALREMLAAYFYDATRAEALHPLVLPAFNVTRGVTKVFKTPHGSASRGDENVRVLGAAQAAITALAGSRTGGWSWP